MYKYSFILPAYKAKFLAQAIASVLNQSYDNFDLMIIDDASPEDLKSIVERFDDRRIKYIRNDHNIGGESLVKQWNHCLQYADGDYTILAADDDVYNNYFLEEINKLVIKYPEVDLLRSRVKIIDDHNNIIGIDGITPELTSKYQYLYYWLNATIFTCIGNYVFKTTSIKKESFIDFPCAFGSDTASTINLSFNGVANTQEMLFNFRISDIHLSSNKGKLKEKLEANNQLFEWFKKLNYSTPTDSIDLFCYKNVQWKNFYQKYKFDCFNLVIKHIPINKLFFINRCRLLFPKDKITMFIRYFVNKILT